MQLESIFRWWVTALSLILIMNYGLAYISPESFWPAYFFSLSVPVLFLLVAVNFIIAVVLRKKSLLFISLTALLITSGSFSATYQLSFQEDTEQEGDLKVLNYNVHIFNYYDNMHQEDKSSSEVLIQWLLNQKVDIVCLQEYYNEPTSEQYDIINRMRKVGFSYFHESIVYANKHGDFGLAIFSRHPIINFEDVLFESDIKQNRAHYVDVLIESDTVRVMNVHLESFANRSLHFKENGELKSKKEALKYFTKTLIYRARQADLLDSIIQNHEGKMIVCGDFNALPYEYPYKKINSNLNNAFEEKGEGFGFTRYGKPFPVRIDNQFFSDGLSLKSFKTFNNLRYSDHVPLIGIYSCD